MDLLDYQRLRNKFEISDVKGKLTVHLYSVDEENVTMHTECDDTIRDYLKEVKAAGAAGETFVKDSYILLGIGKIKDKNTVVRNNVKKSAKSLISILKRYKEHEIEFKESKYTEDVVFGFIISGYEYDFLKEKSDFSCKLTSSYKQITEIAHSQNFARFLGDSPANLMTPALFCEYAKSFVKADTIILEKEDLKKENMNIMLSVSQGSENEPKLLHMRYFAKKDEPVDIALVGKGVTFDAGGVSIKPSANMHKMKMDMMGGATLLATFKLIVDLKLKLNATLTIPLVENTINGLATKPGDVFKGMKGKTVEVNNTDAEGRLILADAIGYAEKDKPKYVFDAATLTGAMVISLGSVYAGFFTNNHEIADKIIQSGRETDDRMWRMPLSPFYREALDSNVATICNIGSRYGQSSQAAEFIKEFVENKDGFVHFDIAGVMDSDYNNTIFGKEASGRPVRGFFRIMEKLSE